MGKATDKGMLIFQPPTRSHPAKPSPPPLKISRCPSTCHAKTLLKDLHWIPKLPLIADERDLEGRGGAGEVISMGRDQRLEEGGGRKTLKNTGGKTSSPMTAEAPWWPDGARKRPAAPQWPVSGLFYFPFPVS